MSIYKRGDVYWYKFMWNGELIRESTRQTNDKVARQIEAAHRTSLAKGEVGIREKKAIPTLAAFCKDRLEPWAKATFEQTVPNNWLWFRDNLRVICGYKAKDNPTKPDRARFQPPSLLASLPLDKVTNEKIAEFASARLKDGYAISTVNSTIRVIRRTLHLAAEWGVIPAAPAIKRLPGERQREHVVTPEEESQYLVTAEKNDPELGHAVICLADTGMRPDEFYRMRWENVNWRNGSNGALFIANGKTAAARRVLHMTPRLRFVLEARWEQAGSSKEGWVWPSTTKSGHFEESTLKKRHRNNLAACAKEAATRKGEGKSFVQVRPFVFYNLRHTFLTRLGESGCDVWTHAKIAGWGNIGISTRYVHPSEQAVLKAYAVLGGHNSGHTAKTAGFVPSKKSAVSADAGRVEWRARRDSNSRPIAPEAIALSS
jgi:integrase